MVVIKFKCYSSLARELLKDIFKFLRGLIFAISRPISPREKCLEPTIRENKSTRKFFNFLIFFLRLAGAVVR